MTSSYQAPLFDQDVNVILPVPQARALYNSLLAAATQPCSSAGEPPWKYLEPSADFKSAAKPSQISNSTSSPSPSQLQPALQLSTSTLCSSDFHHATGFGNISNQASADGDAGYITPAPRTHSCQGSWTAGPTASHEAFRKHMEESMPNVQKSSKRLHQVLGLRNEDTYELPKMPLPPGPESIIVRSAVQSNPALKHLRGANAGLGIRIGETGVAPGLLRGKTNLQMGNEQQRRAGAEGVLPQPQLRPVERSLTLRESLLMYGKQPYGNQVKTELRSLTFHDLTPDMRTGGFKNEMLAHFEADVEGRTRLMSYEVNVPIPDFRPPIYSSSGAAIPLTERWHFLLISTPLVTFKPGTMTDVTRTPSLPPNLPTTDSNKHPPNSWLLFAAPNRAIRLHPPCKDHIIVRTPNGGEAFRPVKRYDYDYSFNGIPNFEFMDKSSVLGPALGSRLDHTIGGPFLCGRDVAAYEPGKDFITPPRTESGGDDTVAAPALRDQDERRWADGANLEREMANSWWWNECQGKFFEDRNTWVRIQDSMARSCCRVVTRVQDEAGQHRRQRERWEMQEERRGGSLLGTAGSGTIGFALGTDAPPVVGLSGLSYERLDLGEGK